MNKPIIILLMVLLASFSWYCEKDDICADTTPTTPLLVVDFYDFVTKTQLKNVSNLRVVESSQSEGFNFDAVSSIKIPLKTTQDNTTFNFILNGADDITTNDVTDSPAFNYGRTNTYISRACGYKTTFKLNDTNGFVLSTSNWILDYEIVQPNVENNNETHVKIYF